MLKKEMMNSWYPTPCHNINDYEGYWAEENQAHLAY